MKKSLTKLLSTAMVLLFVAIMFSMVTMAWLAMNQEVKATGMKMEIKATPNLIISDTASDLSKATDGNALNRSTSTNNTSTSYFSVNWSKAATTLECATHDWTVGTTAGLKYNTNATVVSRDTGLSSGSTALTFGNAVNGSGKTYYVDYVVYIASLNEAMSGKLTVTLGTTATLSNAYKSASIDFYVNTVSNSTYKGTLNLAGYSKDGNSKTSVTTLTLADAITIPVVSGTPVMVTMRCYFDGALIDREATSSTYVRSSNLSTTANFSFDVDFKLE